MNRRAHPGMSAGKLIPIRAAATRVAFASLFLVGLVVTACPENAWAQSDENAPLAQTSAPDWEKPQEAGESALPEAANPEAPAAQPNPAPGTAVQKPAEPANVPDFFRAYQAEWDKAAATTANDSASSAAENAPANRGWHYYMIRSTIGLLSVCGGILLLGYLLRRYGKRNPLLAGQRLGVVVGKVHLGPKAALHFVKTGGRMLVIGVTPNSISHIADFDSEAFELAAESDTIKPEESIKSNNFLAQLHAQTEELRAEPVDDDLASLRGDIQRLKQYLQESSRADAGE